VTPWETLDRARTPDGTELVLARRGDEHVIRANGLVLMSSRQHRSEELLADTCSNRMSAVLVGGLGLGYTLRAVLDRVAPAARVTVAELVPAVVKWNREVLGVLAGKPLDDPRVTVAEGDVLAVARNGRYDAILLDVDNGPGAFTDSSNRRLYGESGLRNFRRSLNEGGQLVVWSAGEDRGFVRRAERIGFRVEVRLVPARTGSGARHVLFVLAA